MNLQKTILLTNDDGYHAPGIRHIYDVLSKENRVIVVAPDKEQSGVGHAFTYNRPLHYEKVNDHMQGYIVSGSPADCVKFAISFLMPQRPDCIVSGMNLGENSGLSAFYSGTVAAAREGAFWNIASIAFSVCKESSDYSPQYAIKIPLLMNKIIRTHSSLLDKKVFYNVNFPICKPSEVRGTRVTWQSLSFFDDRYEKVEVENHHTKEGYLIYGEKIDIEPSNAFDSRALMNNYITISPLMYDNTAHGAIPHLQWIEE